MGKRRGYMIIVALLIVVLLGLFAVTVTNWVKNPWATQFKINTTIIDDWTAIVADIAEDLATQRLGNVTRTVTGPNGNEISYTLTLLPNTDGVLLYKGVFSLPGGYNGITYFYVIEKVSDDTGNIGITSQRAVYYYMLPPTK